MAKTSWKVLQRLRVKYVLQGERVFIGDTPSWINKLILNLTNGEGPIFTGAAEIGSRKRWWKHHLYVSVEMLLTAQSRMVGFRSCRRGEWQRGAAAAPVHGPWASSSLSRLAALPRQQSCSSVRQRLPSTGFWEELHCIKTPPLLC